MYLDGWGLMGVGVLETILSELPTDAFVCLGTTGTLSILDANKQYLGYIDIAFEERFIGKDEVDTLAAKNIDPYREPE